MVNANVITWIRTPAVSALATDFLAKKIRQFLLYLVMYIKQICLWKHTLRSFHKSYS
ncbi:MULTISPECIES: hypothetical protein [Lactococcus]|uniref:hypothetical protein n=1 Tax=Lactococcus TaxID=1357 RepID=UPI001E282CA1|nr:hypothetical protein [Lactococcus lactis]MCI2095835.1 hypothetical protein [Lactococcus lactis]MDG4957637.1 hypothetical protein [Lactococcus lactis]